jgi:hypothetical protein
VGGLALAVGVACGGGSSSSEETPTAASTATATSEPSATRTATATNTPSPIPTPTPYNGKVMRLRIPVLSVDSPIEDLAINSAGELDTPKDENVAVGWYYIYDKPGRLNPENFGWLDWGGKEKMEGFFGNSVFSAHVYYHSIPAPFQRLASLKGGEEIIVTMEDGRQYTYTVVSNTRYHRDSMPMGEILWPAQKAAEDEWITLITCGGELDSSGQEYVSRDVIVAQRKP